MRRRMLPPLSIRAAVLGAGRDRRAAAGDRVGWRCGAAARPLRDLVLPLVLSQLVLAVLLTALVLTLRLLRPIAQLSRPGRRDRRARAPNRSRHGKARTKLAPLGQHLGEMRARADGLLDEGRTQEAPSCAKMAMYDPLTGLSNRSLFPRAVPARGLHGAARRGASWRCSSSTSTRFKTINDALGHARRRRAAARHQPAAAAIAARIGSRLPPCRRRIPRAAAARRPLGKPWPQRRSGCCMRSRIPMRLTRRAALDDAPAGRPGRTGVRTRSLGQHRPSRCIRATARSSTGWARHADLAMHHAKQAGPGRATASITPN